MTLLLIVNNGNILTDGRTNKRETRTFTKTVFIMPLRNNILLQRPAQPRRVTLPNGQTSLARHEHVNRASLYPTNVRIKITYRRKIGPRRQRKPRKKQQEGSGYIDSQNIIRGINLGKRAANTGIDLGKRAANTEVGRMIVDDVVSLIPKG